MRFSFCDQQSWFEYLLLPCHKYSSLFPVLYGIHHMMNTGWPHSGQCKIPRHFHRLFLRHSYPCSTPNPKLWQDLKNLDYEKHDAATKLISFCVLSIAHILPINTGEYVLFFKNSLTWQDFSTDIPLTFPWQLQNLLTFPGFHKSGHPVNIEKWPI